MYRLDFIGVVVVALLVATHESVGLHDPPSPALAVIATDAPTRAGSLEDGILYVNLVARAGALAGDEAGRSSAVLAFGEPGRPLQVPGPTIRVTVGTWVRVSLVNRTGVPLLVQGLGHRSLFVAEGQSEVTEFLAETPGTRSYVAEPAVSRQAPAIPSALSGPIIVEAHQDEGVDGVGR